MLYRMNRRIAFAGGLGLPHQTPARGLEPRPGRANRRAQRLAEGREAFELEAL